MENVAPFASITIPVYLQNLGGPRYRLLSCVECSASFLERDGDSYYRVGVKDLPESGHINASGGLPTHCGKCGQQYTVYFSDRRVPYTSDPLGFQRPQSIYLSTTDHKHMRDTYCLECHHAYYSISDRIAMVADSSVPIEYVSTGFGPMEVRCKFQKCKQRWQVRV